MKVLNLEITGFISLLFMIKPQADFLLLVQLMRVKSDIMKNLDPRLKIYTGSGGYCHILGLIGINRKSELAAFR